ncbi:MAG: riboflavin biosynthesis protein RibF [Clostridia bacterium]|nr:riboflavin biosynthesis protein RibF [Clostridia bacterium]
MINFDFFKGSNNRIVLALGFFDCIHLGHLQLLEKTKLVAKSLGVYDCVFTFKNDLSTVVRGKNGLVCTFDERREKLEKIKINSMISTVFTKEFSNLLAEDFLKILFDNFLISAIVCGKDYRFGKDGLGDVNLLKKFCDEKGISLFVEDDALYNGEKISTTLIKKLLLNGDLKTANHLLNSPYQISGEVIKDRQVGRKLGFPTANVLIQEEKSPLKIGVYKTFVIIDGVRYNCITNYGARPTFLLEKVLTETYIDGFCGDLYGKNLTVYFTDFIRDCVKFESENQLISQLKEDLEKIR